MWTAPASGDRLIYPRLDGVRFLESFGAKEDSDAPQVPTRGSPFPVIDSLTGQGINVRHACRVLGVSARVAQVTSLDLVRRVFRRDGPTSSG
jgi:hypothetical protein